MDYCLLSRQIESFLSDSENPIGVLTNITALIKEESGWFWVGFYFIKDKELILGPFQGPIACMKIGYGKGVCGTSWKDKETIIVPDVEKFPGHIACSSLSKSEIVVPLIYDNKCFGVLDIDSEKLHTFSEEDAKGLEIICKKISGYINSNKILRVIYNDFHE